MSETRGGILASTWDRANAGTCSSPKAHVMTQLGQGLCVLSIVVCMSPDMFYARSLAGVHVPAVLTIISCKCPESSGMLVFGVLLSGTHVG